MHEFSVCQALLTEVQRLALESRAGPVSRIVLRVGPLSGVEPGLLARAFEVARLGSAAELAELRIEGTPVRVQCLACAAECDAAPNRLVCAQCGGWRTRLLSGDELILQRLEFQAPAPAGAQPH